VAGRSTPRKGWVLPRIRSRCLMVLRFPPSAIRTAAWKPILDVSRQQRVSRRKAQRTPGFPLVPASCFSHVLRSQKKIS